MPAAATSHVPSLLTLARGGDAGAAGRLLAAYETYLSILARGQIGRRLRDNLDAEDVVQATFLDARRQLPHLRGTTEAELTAWVRRILSGQPALILHRYFRTGARDANLERQLGAELEDSSRVPDAGLVADTSTPNFRASRREQAVLLAAALDPRHVERFRNKATAAESPSSLSALRGVQAARSLDATIPVELERSSARRLPKTRPTVTRAPPTSPRIRGGSWPTSRSRPARRRSARGR